MGKIHICHVVPNFGLGGAERLVVDLIEATNKKLFEVTAVSLYPKSGAILEREIKKKGFKIYFLDKRKGPDFRMILQLYRLFRAIRPDVVHTHRYVLRYSLLPTILSNIPVRIHTVHNIAQKEVDHIGKLIHCVAFRLGGVVPVGISKEVSRTIKEVYGNGIDVPIIYNGIPVARFICSAVADNAREGKEVILLHIGRFVPQKNHVLLIEAFDIAVKEYPTMRLWLVGDGPLCQMLKKLVDEKRLSGKVSFLGLRNDVPKLLAEADIVILSSDWEGVPITVLEAMAAGKSVIATAVGGVPELVEDAITGVLVPLRDPNALAQAILCLAKDMAFRQRMGGEAQRRSIERFDISNTARAYEELYLKLLKADILK